MFNAEICLLETVNFPLVGTPHIKNIKNASQSAFDTFIQNLFMLQDNIIV